MPNYTENLTGGGDKESQMNDETKKKSLKQNPPSGGLRKGLHCKHVTNVKIMFFPTFK